MSFDVLRVGELARFWFTPEEVVEFTRHINGMLEMIAILPEVPEEAEVYTREEKLENLRGDNILRKSLDSSQILANAPNQKAGFFVA